MGRPFRFFTDGEHASYHIISKVAGGGLKLGDEDKEYFVNLMFKLSKGYFVDITSYTVMSNHFHILLSSRVNDALHASKDELISRYKDAFGKNAEHPEGSYIKDTFEIDYDEDGGVERLRKRLGSLSRFIQDLKQRFSKWYNRQHKDHHREGLWGNRFKGIKISKGDAELICSAYIDLNSLRAGIVSKPEDYRWSSLGLRVRNPKKAMNQLSKIVLAKEAAKTITDSYTGRIKQISKLKVQEVSFPVYQSFIYESGSINREGTARISEEIYRESQHLFLRLGLGYKLKYRYRNLTEGIAFGSYELIEDIQGTLGRKFIKPRKITGNDKTGEVFYSTRKLKSFV